MTEQTPSINNFYLRDFQDKRGVTVEAPTLHIARGYEQHIPFLSSGGGGGRPIVCISDWQCETSTQRFFWTQTWRILEKEIGKDLLRRALVIVAGDMASKDNRLRGSKSDDVPDYSWLQESFPQGDILIVYGNHDFMSREHLQMINTSSGLPCLLPHGSWCSVSYTGVRHNVLSQDEIDSALEDTKHSQYQAAPLPEYLQYMTKEERRAYKVKQASARTQKRKSKTAASRAIEWQRDHPDQMPLFKSFLRIQSIARANAAMINNSESEPFLRVGAVHGVPATFHQGLQKVERQNYFRLMEAVCDPATPIDVLVTHHPPCLPGLETMIRQNMYRAFLQSQACLHVCGHVRLPEPISIVSEGKVVVNADHRLVVFVPASGGT